ncbi:MULTISPECIES: 1,4-alpha-glucan branching enzyme [Streptomyces]|uniref:1,4-alpha-glucan branching enzyme GlgB n=1 Tax=Streptomyces koelreuteriae TaxID=2838015 RepID=A0ABX8FP92_9ACTN|nr:MULTISPECIES: 1,4-alpha-glucan branching enzyme [Streptomyces]QWB22993.1 1,4-alpha-glucan branching enzyme [Streptomyces koelreuteriae]UUA05941.1 1,4-alpha-glucan branching enzyme [Streptomyces koelreuteriae]UUA13569.1 1,4-alpha-glucan branching enzyme [Streptomyces sp. CRCS-T-1]
MTPRSESSGSHPKKTAGEKIPEQPTAAQRKSAAKKTAVPKQAAKKAAAKKSASAQSPAKTTSAAKKAVAKKADPAQATAAKSTAKKVAATKAAAKKTPAKKAAAKKTAAQKTTTAKAVAKKATTAKAAATRTTAAGTPAKKAAAKKATAKRATAKRAPAKTATAKKTPAKTAGAKAAGAGKAAAKKAAPAQVFPPEMEIAVSPAVDAVDRERLLGGTHHDPHSVLGAHPVPGGVAFRAFRPYALSVTVVAGELRAELHDDGQGFFSGLLPLREVPAYRLLVAYEGTLLDTEDAYRFLPTLGDLDLHLIGEGRHEELWTALGAHPTIHEGVTGTRFSVWAPNARGVRVAGTFNFWDGTGHAMRSLGSSGVWELFLPDIGEGELYKFDITRPDGSKTLRADPLARRTEVPPATSSVITSSAYEWGDAEWLARRAEAPAHEAPFSVYEVHLASWRPGLTYRQLADQLPGYVKNLGFTHVELMPVAEHPFGGSWGYQVTGFYAPTARLGTPDDFRHLVDSLHRAGIGVLMDWVPAHFPRDDWALAEFDGRPLYEHEDPLRAAHPDWGTLEFDFGRREVRNFLVSNALYWCEEFHIDGLRVDAVASMLYLDYSREAGQWTPNEHGGRENLDAVAFLQEMNATVYRRVPGVVTIAEESTAWDGVTRATHHEGPSGFGGLGFGLKWNMGWMHDSLQYMSHEPVHRKYHHHEMTFSMVYAYSENYVLPISHDEVVHGKRSLVSKMPGDWWQQRAGHRAYLGFMWAHPGKQLLFMGQEFAQGAEWSEAHGPDWWLLDPGYGAEPDHRGVRDLVRDLNTVYRATPALWRLDTDPAGFEWIVGDAADDNVLAFLRLDPEGTPILAVSNFAPVTRQDYRLGVPEDVPAWHEAVNTDAARYGGSDITNPDPVKPEAQPWHGRPASIRLTLPPLSTVWLRPA